MDTAVSNLKIIVLLVSLGTDQNCKLSRTTSQAGVHSVRVDTDCTLALQSSLGTARHYIGYRR